jgi:HK97 family phage prohead protease
MLFTRSLFEVAGLEIREAAAGGKILAGYAVVWEKKSLPIYGQFRELVRRGAFTQSLKENNIRALWNHNSDFVLGAIKPKTLRLEEDERGLKFEIDLPETTMGHDAAVTIKRGDIDGMSFAFQIRKEEWDESNPKEILRTLIDVDLREISPTAFPAYPQTKVGVRSVEDDFAEFKAAREKRDQELQAGLADRELFIRKQKLNLI